MGFLGFIFTVLTLIIAFALLVAVFFPQEVKSTREKDPAAKGYLEIVLLYPGLHALISHRICHCLWNMKIPLIPRIFSQITRLFTGIEIHPGAQIGKGLFIDHGMGVVIGETVIIGSDVTLFQGVTLGGTGKQTGKRHPTLEDNVVVGAGAKVLGNITIGTGSYVGANAVVIRDVPAQSTVVGVPGHVTKKDGKKVDIMDHVHVSDPIMQHMKDVLKRIKSLEDKKEN